VPYTPTSPTVVLCQNLASAVQTAWGPTAPSAADWDFFKRYGDADEVAAAALVGRQVVFFPSEYAWDGATRAEDEYTHSSRAWWSSGTPTPPATRRSCGPPSGWTSSTTRS
jgi:hypothetical protein